MAEGESIMAPWEVLGGTIHSAALPWMVLKNQSSSWTLHDVKTGTQTTSLIISTSHVNYTSAY